MSEFKEAFTQSIPLLETALGFEERFTDVPPSMRLRGTVCGLATGALQLYLKEAHGVDSQRLVTYSSVAPREYNGRRMSHVLLESQGQYADPTCTQFLKYVGLTPEHPGAVTLFPVMPYGMFEGEGSDFVSEMAIEAHRIEPLIDDFDRLPSPAIGALRGVTMDEKQAVYRDVWDVRHYDELALAGQLSLARSAERVARRMIELTIDDRMET